MASYLSSKKSPTVSNLEKINVVVTPEDKNDIHLGKAVIHNLREIVDKTKLLRTDGARTAISIITASTNGSNIQNEKKKVLLGKKIGLPVKRISGGKNVRAKILSSEESCWKYIQRKTRKNAISHEIKKIAYDFWLHPDNSRPSPNKTDIKRVRIAPKQFSKHTIHILDKTQTEIFHEFKIKYPEVSMNQRTFERLKPFFVRAASPKDRLTCCCRYHIEAKSLFLKCMEFRKKHIQPQLSEKRKNKFPVYEHLTDIWLLLVWQKTQQMTVLIKPVLIENAPNVVCAYLISPIRNLVTTQRLQLHSVLELGVESFPDDPCIVTEHFFVISSDEKHDQCFTKPEKLTVRYMSCYSCEECVNGNYNICTNNAIGRKEVVPIRPDDKGTIDDDENDNEYTMSDLIVEGTVLALYTEKENAEFYLLRASSCPEKLRTSEVDDWGVSFRKNTKIIRGQYFKSDLNRSKLSYKLIRRKKAIVPEASVIYISPQLRVNS
ncbi:unnamed protein product [Mytilus coruscus]|uniref:Uncharacterized protein n=1 Tax=Mytilus coruscus TaxID=42192 RepID=A0A6J8D1L7_MYTCO|nr:unnamed protein product [Mytilus coruscus]